MTTARDTAVAAIDAGITYFDTAPYYGFGLSEGRVGDDTTGSSCQAKQAKVAGL
jgi:aryl-alcohol dehydrogenase-like predicted oxidoreductase